MKSFEFDYKNQRWDAYKAFHRTNGPFVEFSDGSVMLNYEPKLEDRKYYDKYGVHLVSTADLGSLELFLDEKKTQPVTKAWLNTAGQQVLAVDMEERVAVKAGSRQMNSVSVPSNKYGCMVHWAGAKRRPVSLGQVFVSQPDYELRKLLTPILDEVRSVVTAALRIKEDGFKHQSWGESTPISIQPEWEHATKEELVAWALDDTVRAYSNRAWRVSVKGFETPRRITDHQYLYI
jgi:hypothetical protein